ncbi:uncharacterized protein LOC118437491 [Folsomia candida]|uniref:uncharacterized protein LOC118437491 n=1 Tax=Folsomia candida TaxID=158441 RepID=UPI0016055414|nr:uncharacterized protein LOC118437491 [Folsomia candida]
MNDTEQRIFLKVYESKEAARHSVEIGDTIGFMHFPINFSQHNLNRLAFHRFAASEDLVGSTVQISLDMTNKITTSFVVETLQEKYLKFVEKMVSRTKPDMDLRQIHIPLKFNNDNSSGYQFGWQDYLLPAFIPIVIFLFSMICAFSLIKDQEDGTLNRSQACGVELWHVYVSYFVSESPTTLAQIGIFIISRFLQGGYTNKGSFWLCFVNAFLSGWIGIAMGLLVATVLSRSMEVVVFLLLVLLTSLYSSGKTP